MHTLMTGHTELQSAELLPSVRFWWCYEAELHFGMQASGGPVINMAKGSAATQMALPTGGHW